MWEAGWTLQEIADELETSRASVSVTLTKMRQQGEPRAVYRRSGYGAAA